VSIVIPMGQVTKDNFTDDTQRRLFLPYYIDNQYSLDKIEATVDTIEEFLYAHQAELDIESVYSYYNNNRA